MTLRTKWFPEAIEVESINTYSQATIQKPQQCGLSYPIGVALDVLSYSGEPEIFGKRNGSCSIIIPCYSELAMLEEHLNALSLQDNLDFDVIIVASNVLDMEKARKLATGRQFCVSIIRRGSDTGSAGGFYAGQRYAMANGCKCMIFADVDAIPIGKSTVGTLLSAFESGHELVQSGAKLHFEGESVVDSKPAVLPFYALISASLVKRAGYVFAPAYNGSEDNDYLRRLSSLAKPFVCGNWVRHPVITPFFSKSFDRDGRYIINQLVLLSGPRMAGYHFFTTALLAPIFIIFGKPYARSLAIFVLQNTLLGRYGRVLADFRTSQQESVAKVSTDGFGIVLTTLEKQKCLKNAEFIPQVQGIAAKLMRPLHAARMCLRKKSLLYITNQLSIPVSMVFGRESWLYARDGTAYPIADNGNPFIHALRLVLFAFSFPFFLSFSAFLFILRMALKPETRGYGLGK